MNQQGRLVKREVLKRRALVQSHMERLMIMSRVDRWTPSF